jgi:hypothetical protein
MSYANMAMLLALASLVAAGASAAVPIVANTWAFTNATEAAWTVLHENEGDPSSALKAVEQVVLLHIACRQATSCLKQCM